MLRFPPLFCKLGALAIIVSIAGTALGEKADSDTRNGPAEDDPLSSSEGRLENFSPKALYYQTSYKKPTSCCPAEIHVIFGSDVGAETAEEFLREEIERAMRHFAPEGDITVWAWRVEESEEDVAASDQGEESINLPDGSTYLIYDADTDRIETENTYYRQRLLPEDPEKVIEVQIDFEIERSPLGKVRVSGRTNLPDQMVLYADLRNRSTGWKNEQRVVVDKGTFVTEWIETDEGTLPSGDYEISITSPIRQPEAVQQIIGEKGENLSGGPVTATLMGKGVYLKVTREIE